MPTMSHSVAIGWQVMRPAPNASHMSSPRTRPLALRAKANSSAIGIPLV